MQKIFISFLVFGLLPLLTRGQSTRVGSCSNHQSARFYIMPYAGAGPAWYSYPLNGTVMDSTGYSYEREKSGTIPSYFAGVTALYHFETFNLGIGGEWQGFSGTTDNGYTQHDLSLYYFKAYGRFEFLLYTSSFNDFGLYGNVGAVFPQNAPGTNAKTGLFIDLGLYYNLVINQSSAFYFSLGYQQASFQTSIGNSISKNRQSELRLSLGYRFWF